MLSQNNLGYCGHLPTSLVGGQTSGCTPTSWTVHVQCLYISWYVTVNKPVLSYLSLRLLPQWWPRPGCTLCTVHCTSVHPLTRRHLQALVALFHALVSDISFQSLQCALHWLQFRKLLKLPTSLRSHKLVISFFLLEVDRSYHNTQFWTRLFYCSYLIVFFRTVLDPGLSPQTSLTVAV